MIGANVNTADAGRGGAYGQYVLSGSAFLRYYSIILITVAASFFLYCFPGVGAIRKKPCRKNFSAADPAVKFLFLPKFPPYLRPLP